MSLGFGSIMTKVNQILGNEVPFEDGAKEIGKIIRKKQHFKKGTQAALDLMIANKQNEIGFIEELLNKKGGKLPNAVTQHFMKQETRAHAQIKIINKLKHWVGQIGSAWIVVAAIGGWATWKLFSKPDNAEATKQQSSVR